PAIPNSGRPSCPLTPTHTSTPSPTHPCSTSHTPSPPSSRSAESARSSPSSPRHRRSSRSSAESSPASCCSPSRCGRSCRGEPQSWAGASPLRRRLLPLHRSHSWGRELRRLGGGSLLQPGEHLGDGAIELRIVLGEELPGSVLDLDIGLDAEVLHTPVLALEPERIAGLGHLGAVDEFVAAVDADHTAPGAHADDRADPLGLDAGVDDVA